MRAFFVAAACFAMYSQSAVKSGVYEVTLRLPADGLVAQEEMQIEYRVTDTSRVDPVMGAAPVIRAQARSVIEMPAMPGMAKLIETAHPEGVPGEYGVHPVFPHGGEYRLTLTITPPGAKEFSVQFPINVGDGGAARGKPKPRPYFAEVRSTPRNPRAGEPAELVFTVRSRINGVVAVVKEFDIQHERPMHLIAVRSDLGEFAHEHPEPSPSGEFKLRYTFPSAGEYTLFVDAAPRGAGGQVMPVQLKVSGPKTAKFQLGSMPLDGDARAGPIHVKFATAQYSVGRTLRLESVVRDAKSNAAVNDIQPYLGALGHMILVHEDGLSFVHSHPDELDEKQGRDGRLAFLARFPKPGRYRAWVQVQREGTVHTAPFVVEAR